MKLIATATIATLFIVNTQAFLENKSVLVEDTISLAYSETLACGGCIRAGYTYCMDMKNSGKGRPSGDVCCNSADCVLKAMVNNDKLECATTDLSYSKAKDFFKDKYVMMQKFCMKR